VSDLFTRYFQGPARNRPEPVPAKPA